MRVDFAQKVAAESMVGFVHGMDTRAPTDAMIEPLAPGLWRGKLADVPYQRTQDLGGRYTYVISDRWGYPGFGKPAPWEDYPRWRSFVRDVARRAVGQPLGQVVFDVWNEPDLAYFWQGTREQFFETYRIAEQVIRSELGPEAMVVGPSTSRWLPEWTTGLVDFCLARGCQVGALAWHELDAGSFPAVGERVRQARETLVENPRYAPVRIRELHVSEVVSAYDSYQPAEVIGSMHYLESGGADHSARACWTDPAGQDNCYNNTLGGLLVPGTMQPRSVWWATRLYAEGVSSRRLTRFSDEHVIGLGSAASAASQTAQLLVAHLPRRPRPRAGNPSQLDVAVTLRSLTKLPWLRGERQLRVGIERLPDSGSSPLVAPKRRSSRTVTIRAGQAAFTLTDVYLHQAFRLTLTAP